MLTPPRLVSSPGMPSPPAVTDAVSSDGRWIALLIAVAAGVHAAALYNSTPLQSANDRSRWSTVWSLVHRGSFAIDEIDADPSWHTIDKVQHEGHLYSTKPALLTVISAEVYRLVRRTLGWSIYGDPAAVTRIVLLFVNLIPWVGALALLARIGSKYTRSNFSRWFLLLTSAFGTYLSTFSVTFNNHTVAAVSLVFALHFGLRIVADRSRAWWDFALCGLTSAFVTTNELPAAVFGLAMFALLLRSDWRRTLFIFVPAALVPIGAFVVTTWYQTGSWKPFYLSYGTEKYVYIRDGLPSYWAEPRGLDRNLDSPLIYFLHCTIGHHGIVSLSPVFGLAIVSWLRMWKRPDEPYRPFLWMGLGMTVFILAFYLSRTANYNYGGNTSALRWAIWLVPFWLIAMLPTLEDFGGRRWFRIVAALLLAVSTFSAWESIGNPWKPSWLYRAMESAGWIDYRDHDPPLPKRLTTWIASLPAADADPQQEWVELTSMTDRGRETIRLEMISGDAAMARIRLTRTATALGREDNRKTVSAQIARPLFDRGESAARFVTQGEPTPAAAVQELQRLPLAVEYSGGRIRYQKTSLREVAFRTQHATATVDVKRRTGDMIRHRVEAWLCPDVPFGVVRLRETMTNASTGHCIYGRDYVLSAAGRMDEPEWAAAIQQRADHD